VTGEDAEKLISEISAELEQLGDDEEKPLSRAERKHRAVLSARKEALERLKAAIAEGDFSKETRASLDYGLLTEYGERHFLLFNFVKSQVGWRLWW
jgi:hypothetical protein